ncbi:hypothetical protein PGT21_022493 [Puccinia graminis f. sp. tritici]|uniref:Rho-GAP domain-containing protein n=1 Tax=Puccinia graminis f. sp. tritici TaxID=56615 RepID=A0A5B0QC49_PUCGR|nr:hypothetical protein PGT21_022493 [Puccinia graminis f. sp. tritici]
MPSSLINNDSVPSTPRSPMPYRSRTTSLLPIPTRSSTSLSSSLRGPSHPSPTAQSPSSARNRSTISSQKSPSHSVQYSVGSVRTPTRLPISRQPSFSPRETPVKSTTLSPKSSMKTIALSSASSKPAAGISAGPKKPADKLNDEQADHFRNLSKSFNHTLRRIPRISTVNITVDKAYPLPTPLSTPVKSQRSGPRRPTASNALPLSQALRQLPPLQSRSMAFHQTRKVKSYQELKESNAAAVPRATKHPSSYHNKPNASPESLQSKITLTDDGSSVRTKLEYNHHASISSSVGPLSETPSPDLALNRDNRPAAIQIPPQALPSTVANSEYPEPQEFQSRAYTLERLQSLIGMDEFQSLVDSDALYWLISQPGLYETQLEIQERAFQVYAPQNATDGQKPHAVGHTPLGFDFPQSRPSAAIPHATLEAAAHRTPSSSDPVPLFEGSPMAPSEAPLAGLSSGPKKSNHVGNILLEKLGWKSKSSTTQNNKQGSSKSTGRSLRPSSFILTASSQKGKLSGQFGTPAKLSISEQHRFSQILGANLEKMNNSTCVVSMGERLQVLPILPFTVIEEIYRRGMRVPGILRISGDLDRIDELVKKFEFCPKNGVDVSSEDIHTLCGLLKHYLRTLPEPLFHPVLNHMFWKLCVEPSQTRQADPTEDEHSQQLLIARYLLQLLPSRALSLLTYVIRFLAQIPIFVENRIQHDSLAGMLGPAIFVPRDIGLPGLGLHPRGHNKQTSSSTSPAAPFPSPKYTASFIEELDKNAVSRRAAESTLWLMNYSKVLFGAVHDADRRRTGVPAEFKLEATPRESVSSSPKETQQDSHRQPFPSQLTDIIDKEQLTQSPPQSPVTSILTYSSNLTVSQRSTIHEELPEFSPSRSLHSPKQLYNDKLSEFGHGSTRAKSRAGDSEECSDKTLQPDLKYNSPARAEDQHDPKFNEAAGGHKRESSNRLSCSLSTAIGGYSKQTSAEVEKRSRRNSEKVIGLLTNYMEEREEKIVKQESLIESLVEEIERLQTVEEGDAVMQESMHMQTRPDISSRKNTADEVRSDGMRRQQDFELHSALKAEASHDASDNNHNKYSDYHEQMFNFLSPTSDEHTSYSSGTANGTSFETDSDTDSITLNFLNSESADDRRDSKSHLFDIRQEHVEDDVVEELHLGTSASSQNSPTSLRQIRRASKSISSAQAWREPSGRNMLRTGKSVDDLINFDDYDSDRSDAASLHSEITRLKTINSSLIRKLKSIESILADVSFK